MGGAVPPLACALTWTRCTRLAAIISARLAPVAVTRVTEMVVVKRVCFVFLGTNTSRPPSGRVD